MKYWLITVVTLAQIFYANALEISVGKGKVVAKAIAIVPFAGNKEADKLDLIISTDLYQSGVFAPINPSDYAQRPSKPDELDYSQFQKIGAAYVVFGRKQSDGTISLHIADTFQQTILASHSKNKGKDTLRQVAHKISDLVMKKLTGVRGAFATRLVYVHEVGGGISRRYKLMLSDSDGKNAIQLLSSREPIMSPRFSPSGDKIVYVTFEGRRGAQIVTHDVYTGRRALVARYPGLNSSPAWSPDGKKMAMVLSKDGNSEIYFKDLYSGVLVRVTNDPSIDTEPVWSPDSSEIYFTSDRSGKPKIYRVNIIDKMIDSINRDNIHSTGADVSGDGQLVAFSRRENERFNIGILNQATGQMTKLSQGVIDETPRFSPNGKMLVFTSVDNNRSVIKIANIDGSVSNTLSAKGHIRDADWSSYLK